MNTRLAAAALAIGFSPAVLSSDEHRVDLAQVEVQQASATDMAMLEPFIGKFRQPSHIITQTYQAGFESHYLSQTPITGLIAL